MEKDKLMNDDFADRSQDQMKYSWITFCSFTLSTIRWLQRYSHCYSIPCSFICLPLWTFMLPIAFLLDLCIYFIMATVFIVTFLLSVLFYPFIYLYQSLDVCSAPNIYRYSLKNALSCSTVILVCFQLPWLSYCGTGDIESGAPICCTYWCHTSCQNACHQATHVKINQQYCTIL